MLIFILLLFSFKSSSEEENYCSKYNYCISCNTCLGNYKNCPCYWEMDKCIYKNSQFTNVYYAAQPCFENNLENNSYTCGDLEVYDLKKKRVNLDYSGDRYIKIQKYRPNYMEQLKYEIIFKKKNIFCIQEYDINDAYESIHISFWMMERNYIYYDFVGMQFGLLLYYLKNGTIFYAIIDYIPKFINETEIKKISVIYWMTYDNWDQYIHFNMTINVAEKKNNKVKIILIIVFPSLAFIILLIILIICYKKKCANNNNINDLVNNNIIVRVNNNYNSNQDYYQTNTRRKVIKFVPLDMDFALSNSEFLGPKKIRQSYLKYQVNEQCIFCLRNFTKNDTISFTKCSHLFHYKCLYNFIKSTKKETCPICRSDLIKGLTKKIEVYE